MAHNCDEQELLNAQVLLYSSFSARVRQGAAASSADLQVLLCEGIGLDQKSKTSYRVGGSIPERISQYIL